MKVSEILAESRKTFPSLEIVPPLRGITKKELLESIAPFMEFSPKYINVTSHRDEFEYREEADGTFSRHLIRNRISETTVCAAIMSRYDIDVVPHLICGGNTAEEIESRLDNLAFLGINNILALRGDSMAGEKRFTPTPGGYRYASELVEGIRSYQGSSSYRRSRGLDTEERFFCIGVGAYPEKHFEAPNIETDIANLKKKIDAGADYIITQMFFDNNLLYNFLYKIREQGITVPIIPGIMPITNAKQMKRSIQMSGCFVPQRFKSLLDKFGSSPAAMKQAGIAYATDQIIDLFANGITNVHVYSMNKPDVAAGIRANLSDILGG